MLTKTSHLEGSRERDDGGARLLPRILRKMQDEGSFGLFAAHWLDKYAGLRTTKDPLHRNFKDMKRTRVVRSASSSTLWLGLWWSQAFCGQLKQAAETFFKTHDHTCTLFTFVYEGAVHEMGLPTIGMESNEHLEMTWQKVKSCPIWSHRDDTVKLGRWQSTFNVAACGVGRGAVVSWCCSGLASRRVGGRALQIFFSSRSVLTWQCRHRVELGRIASPAASTSPYLSSCPAAFLVAPAVASAATALQSQLPRLLRSHPQSSREEEEILNEGEEIESPKKESDSGGIRRNTGLCERSKGREDLPSAVNVPLKPLFRGDNQCSEKTLSCWQLVSVVLNEGGESYTINLCQKCFNKHLQAKGEKPLSNVRWRQVVEEKAYRGRMWKMMEKEPYLRGMWEYFSKMASYRIL